MVQISKAACDKAGLSANASAVLPKFPPVPPPEREPQDGFKLHAVSDDKALSLLKKLAQKDLTPEEIDAAAGGQFQDTTSGRDQVIGQLRKGFQPSGKNLS